MSILNQTSNDAPTDVAVPVTVASAAGMVAGGTSEVGGADKAITPEEVSSTEPIEYQHVSLPTAGTIRVRYSQIEPLMPRRFQ
jgi:hypothetical protein